MDTTETYCARHRDTATRLSCTQCGTAICPRCLVDAPVGQKCPACAKREPASVRRGKPDQYAKGLAFGVAAAVAMAVVLPIVLNLRFVGLFATGFAGFGVGTAVLRGAGNNRAETFRRIAIGLALAAVLGSFLVLGGSPLPGGLRALLVYAAAAYGAYVRFDR